MGFLIRSGKTGDVLLFFTDTSTVADAFNLHSVTHVIGECNHSMEILFDNIASGTVDKALAKRIAKTHFSLEKFLKLVERFDKKRLRQIYLCHLSDGNSDAELFRQKIVAATGVEVYVC